MMKRALIAIPAILVVLVIVALVAPSFIDWSRYRTQAQTQIKTATGYDLQLNGDFGVAFLPVPHAYLSDAVIAAPAGSKTPYLVKLGRLDLNIALIPLIGGKVEFSSVKLVKPDIALEVMADGAQNWMTPELKKLTAPKEEEANGSAAPASSAPPVSFKNISVQDGRFQYIAGAGQAATILDHIDADIAADTMQGPFDASGDINFAGQDIHFTANTAKMEEGAPLAVKLEAGLKQADIDLIYAGIIDLKDQLSLQGETSVQLNDLKKLAGETALPPALADGVASIKGLLTANADNASLKNARLTMAKNELTGGLDVQMAPLKISGRFDGAKPVNFDDFIPQAEKSAKTSSSAPKQNADGSFTSILPQSITLPVAMQGDLVLSFPSALYKGQTFKNVVIQAAHADRAFRGRFAASGLPGPGAADVHADLNYAAAAPNKTGGLVFSGPSLALNIKADSKNISATIRALAGTQDVALPAGWTAGGVEANLQVDEKTITLQPTVLDLGGSHMQVAGVYDVSGKRPKIKADVSADKLDFDALQQGAGKKTGDAKNAKDSAKQNLTDTLKSFELPYDVVFDIGVAQAKLQGQTITGLRAIGDYADNEVYISNLSAQDFSGTAFKLSGAVQNLKNLSGIDLAVAGQSKDMRGLAKLAGVDPSALPANLNAANLKLSAKGDINKLDIDTAVSALNGTLSVKGNVADPLGQMAVDNLHINVDHGNMAQALKIFAPSAPDYASWQKPLHFSADISTSGKTYRLNNMKGDLAGSSLSGDLSIDQSTPKPFVKGNVTLGDFSMVSAQSAANQRSVSQGAVGGSKWSNDAIANAWMKSFNADVSVKAKSLTYETWNLQNPSLTFTLNNGLLTIGQLSTDLFGGNASMSGTMQALNGANGVSVDGAADLKGVRVEDLVKAMAGNFLIKGKGDVNLNMKLKTSGVSQRDLISALNGNGATAGSNLVFEGFDLSKFAESVTMSAKPGERLAGLLQSTGTGGNTSFDTLDGAFTISSGVVNISKLDLTGKEALVSTTGSLNLPAWTINTAHKISVPSKPDVPPFTIKISGSLDKPAQNVAEGAITNYINQKIEKKVGNILEKKFGDKLPGGLGALLGGGAAETPAPAPASETTPAATATDSAPAATPTETPQPEKVTPESVAKDVLKGFLSR